MTTNSKTAIENLFRGVPVVPVVVLDDAEAAVPLARTLAGAGLPVIEITLRTKAAPEAIRRIAAEVPQVTVGAGSIRSAEHLRLAREAGARFAVSPGASEGLLEAATGTDIAFVPGAVTAGEIMGLLERGYTVQKFFPAELAGGVPMLKALAAPLPDVRFMPTGGISPELAVEYLRLSNVVCVGGSWITPASLVSAGDFEAVGRLAESAAADSPGLARGPGS